MAQVDFYILPALAQYDRQVFACRLIEKAYHRGHHIWVHTQNPQQQEAMDQLLWRFSPSSFVPHAKAGGSDASLRPHVEIDCWHDTATADGQPTDSHQNDVLVNLALHPPRNFQRYQRIIEIVIQEPDTLESTRKNWQLYKEAGLEMVNPHDMRN